MRFWLALLMTAFAASPSLAAWREATTPHFIIYSDGSEAQLRTFADRIEKIDWVMRQMTGITAPPSPLKLRIALVPRLLKGF